MTKIKEDRDRDGNYSAWFYDLQGGKTEYAVTIACVLGRSRMKDRVQYFSVRNRSHHFILFAKY